MTTGLQESLFRYLPRVLRRSGTDTVAHDLCLALGSHLENLAAQSRRLFYARYLRETDQLEDLSRLASLIGLTPWPEESLISFRARVLELTSICVGAPPTARDMLIVVGLAAYGYDSGTAWELNPVTKLINTGPSPTTIGTYASAGSPRPLKAAVVDFPAHFLQNQPIPIDDSSSWTITNKGTDAHAPVIDIAAGSQPVVAPVIVQEDLRQMILVNRVIAKDSICRVNLIDFTVRDLAGDQSKPGPIPGAGGESPPGLLYSNGGVLDEPIAGTLEAGLPFWLVKWVADATQTNGWQPLVTPGDSHWLLLTGADESGSPLTPGQQISADRLEVVPLGADRPERVTFRWQAESQPGTFTIKFWNDDLNSWTPALNLPHEAWLNEQILRLKLAGVQYLDPHETLL